jgi:hypothetical protein
MKVQELIDALYKCSPDANLRIAINGECFEDYSFAIASVLEVDNKLSDEPSTVYLTHD